MKNKKFIIPFGIFFLIFSSHSAYTIFTAIQISQQWVKIEDVNYFLLYFQQQDYMLGLSYALTGAFTMYAFLKFQNIGDKTSITGILGGLTLTGILYAGGCFLIGCCGSPMLIVYLGLFGSSFLGYTKPFILIITLLSLAVALWWIEKKAKSCCCVNDNCKVK